MKISTIFIIGSIILIITWASFATYSNYSENGALEQEIQSHLKSVAHSKAERIGSFLDERKDDLTYLSESTEIKQAFQGDEITEEIDKKLTFFQETNNYHDLILITPKGDVLWTARQKSLIGENLESPGQKETKLAEVYRKVRKDFGVGIFDPGYYGDDEKLSVFTTTPVLKLDPDTGKKNITGLIALQIDNQQIEERITSDVGIKDIGEIYLVNRDGTPITPLTQDSGEQITEVKTEMKKDCFRDYDNYYIQRRGETIEPVKKSGAYQNYQDKAIFGAHQYILRTGWCVMVEARQDLFYKSSQEAWKKRLKNTMYILLAVFLWGLLATLVLERYFEIAKKGGADR